MVKKTSSNQSYGRDSEYKMVRFSSPSVYFLLHEVDMVLALLLTSYLHKSS